MNFWNCFKFSMDILSKRKLNALFIIIMCGISVCLIDMVIVEYRKNFKLEYEAEEVLKVNTKNLYQIDFGYIEMNLEKHNKAEEFIDSINESFEGKYSAGKLCFGALMCTELMENSEYIEINKQHYISEYGEDVIFETLSKTAPMVYMDYEVSQICDMKFEKIIDKDKEKEFIDKGYKELYVGNNFKNVIDVGDTFSNYFANYDFIKCKNFYVKGILEKNANWLQADTNVYGDISMCLDDYFVQIDDFYDLNADGYYIVYNKEGINKDAEVDIEAFEKMAKKKGFNVKIKSIYDIIRDNGEETKDYMKIWVLLAVFTFVIGIISISTISTVIILLNKKNINIMYANGFSNYDIARIFIWENIIKIGFGCIAGFCIAILLSLGNCVGKMISIVMTIQLTYGLALLCGMMLLNIFIASIVPYLYFKNMKYINVSQD